MLHANTQKQLFRMLAALRPTDTVLIDLDFEPIGLSEEERDAIIASWPPFVPNYSEITFAIKGNSPDEIVANLIEELNDYIPDILNAWHCESVDDIAASILSIEADDKGWSEDYEVVTLMV